MVGGAGCPPPEVDTDLLSELPKFEEQRQVLCARGREDAVTRVFCEGDAPDVTSLVELQNAIGIGFQGQRPRFAMTANSTGLSARSVSAINPRAVLVQQPEDRDDASFMSLAYTRGDALVEMAVRPPDGELAFYLLRYEQACDGAEGDGGESGCTFAERLTPETESGWTRWSLYDDVDLKNTVLDCLQCHQPDGPTGTRNFRMQEFQNPWTHWMASFGVGEVALMRDFAAAHGTDEDYAGIPAQHVIGSGNPIDVENFFKASGSTEPSPFPSQVIEEEVTASSPGHPEDNTVPGTSATWDALYDRAVRGEAPPPPYHDVKITDPAKLAAMSDAYTAWRDGSIDGALPDIRDVIRDEALADLSFRPKAGLSGREILVHMCSQCHNGRLDQTTSRARFNALDLDAMDRRMRDLAIERLQRTGRDRFRMPPVLFRELSTQELEAAVAELRR